MRLSQKQNEYIRNANRRWNLKVGAVRSGKSYVDIVYTIPSRLREGRGKDGLNVILGVSRETIERNVLQPMRERYTNALIGNINSRNIARICGENVYCLGAEKVSQVSKIQGSSIKYCYGDEIAKWNQEVFSMLQSRLDKPYSCFDGACNPEYPSHWLKEFIDQEDIDAYIQKYTLFDNPFLNEKFVENLCKEYAGTVYYQRYVLGEWAKAEGLVYPMFSENDHVIDEIPWQALQRGEWYISLDYGTVNPTAAGLWCLYNGTAYMADEYYYDSRAMGQNVNARRTDEEHYAAIEKMAGDRQIERVIVDPSAASFSETIRRHGKLSVENADNDVLNGIRRTSALLQAGRIKIHRKCRGIINEFGQYQWDTEAPEDSVIKENDHAMDALRYLCYTVMWR